MDYIKILTIFMAMIMVFPMISANNENVAQEICKNGIDDDSDGFIDNLDSDCKTKPSSCVTKWVYDSSIGDYVKEDWTHPVLKKIIAEHGENSVEYQKFNNQWKTVPGKYCVAVDENGRKMIKPTTKPVTEVLEVIEVIEETPVPVVIVEDKKEFSFLQWLKDLF